MMTNPEMNTQFYADRRELETRIAHLRERLTEQSPDWRLALIVSKVNQFYFAGTMQDAVLVIPRDGDAGYFARRSFERACDESPLPAEMLHPMPGGYKDVAAWLGEGRLPQGVAVHVEQELMPLAMADRMRKYFLFTGTESLDLIVAQMRAVKAPNELAAMRESGRCHARVLIEDVPRMMREGMSEAELGAELYAALVKAGHQGVCRLNMFDTDIIPGHVSFGDSALYPTNFNGPGGHRGMSPASPQVGSRTRLLNRGDLVFLDVGFGVAGYHTDKTMVYCFGENRLTEFAMQAHRHCVDIQRRAAAKLRPGAVPSAIYGEIMASVDPRFADNFMGFGARRVPFLGHGIGLQIDEYPVIAKRFDAPLENNMVIALEPKIGIAGMGMVGVENSYLVTPDGGECLTDDSTDLILVP